MVCKRMFISLLSLFVVRPHLAYRIQTVSKFWQDEDVSVKTWTWNSGKADLTQEAKRLAKTNADVIVTCQTEATKGIHHFMAEEWQLVAHGEHWGAAGGSINAQMSSAFVRKPLDGSKLVGNVSEIIRLKPWRSDVGNSGNFGLAASVLGGAVSSPLFSALARVTALDYKGKGGVSITLDFHENQVREGFVLQFVCAHLDSETEEARHYGIGQMLSEARAPDLRTANALRKEVVGKSGEMREPCALYDSHRKFCAAEKFELGPEPNAVLLFGDLNFRLSAKNIENISQAYFMDSEGRKMLAKNDRLSQYDPRIFGEKHVKKHLDVLVTPAREKGFGFECNEPFELYPPTYKRKGGKVQLEKEVPFENNWAENLENIQSMYGELGTSVFNVTGDPWLGLGAEEEFPLKVKTSPHEACSTMGKAMLTCGGVLQPQCKDWVYELAQHCYVRKDKKKGLNQWAQKKSDLQLGWLDRFCWRSKHADLKEYGVGVRLSTEEGWMDYPGAKDKDGSDHMPVSATFHFTTVKCSCKQDLVGTNLFVPACQAQLDDIEKKALIGGESYRAECETGYVLRDGRRATTLTCGKDGRLQPYTECHKTCAWNEQDWRRFKRPPVLLAGDEIHLTCKDTEDQLLMLLGVPDIKCNKFGGLVPVDLQRIPACVSVCKLLDQEDVVLKEKKLASSDLLAKYGDELKDKGTLLRDVLLEGGTARYACRNGCISVGDTTRQCGEMEKNMAVKCGCNVRLVVKEMTFDDPKLATQIEKVKFQAYGGPLNQEELEDLRGSKGYKAATKFTMEDLNSKEPNENLAIDIPKPANTELHLTLCSKDRLTFWRCSVLASSSAAASYTVEGLLQFKDSYDGEIKMEIPLVTQWLQFRVVRCGFPGH